MVNIQSFIYDEADVLVFDHKLCEESDKQNEITRNKWTFK